MLQDMIHPPEQQQLLLENISSPLSSQMFEFCEHDLFPENFPNSDVSSCSNNCYCDENSSYSANISLASHASDGMGMYSNNNINSSNNYNPSDILNTMLTNNDLSQILNSQDENEHNITTSMNSLSPSSELPYPIPPMMTTQEEQFDFSSMQVPQLPLTDVTNSFSPYSPDPICPLSGSGPPLPSIFENDCLSTLPSSYTSLDPCSPACSFIDPFVGSFLPGNFTSNPLSTDCGSGIFSSGMLMASELQPEQDFQGDNSNDVYVMDTVQQVFSPTDIQALSNDNQLMINGCSSNNTTPLTSELTNLEESSYKVGRLSVEERKEKIHRYMKKRNERNFSKKIKYACRKTLADSRPRVRGRFAKNDDFGDTVRNSGSNEDDEVIGKAEDEMVDSSDIFAHISGVNSFKCNYPLQSWM